MKDLNGASRWEKTNDMEKSQLLLVLYIHEYMIKQGMKEQSVYLKRFILRHRSESQPHAVRAEAAGTGRAAGKKDALPSSLGTCMRHGVLWGSKDSWIS